MLNVTLQVLFERDLKKLKSEIESYKNEINIWKTDKSIANSAGNLCLHIIGNLNWFVGAQFGKTGYIRQRELEFSSINIPRGDLLKDIDKTILMLDKALLKVTNDQLEAEYLILVFKQKASTYYFLIHLSTHLAYHLCQINYHRRLLNE